MIIIFIILFKKTIFIIIIINFSINLFNTIKNFTGYVYILRNINLLINIHIINLIQFYIIYYILYIDINYKSSNNKTKIHLLIFINNYIKLDKILNRE